MNDWDDRCDEAFVKAKESLIKIVMLGGIPTLHLSTKFMRMLAVMPWGECWPQTYEVQGKDVDLPIGFTSYTFQ